jgi:hypothetical protein
MPLEALKVYVRSEDAVAVLVSESTEGCEIEIVVKYTAQMAETRIKAETPRALKERFFMIRLSLD